MRKILIIIMLLNSGTAFSGQGAYIELLRLSPGIQSFEDEFGVKDKMTEQYIREVVDDMHAANIDTIVIAYIEALGYWFYEKPQGNYGLDRQTGTQGAFWYDKLSAQSQVLVERFDPLDVILSQAEINGQKVYVGLGRNGDLPLLADIHTVNTGGADPLTYGEDINFRLGRAVQQTKAVALDIYSGYGHYASLEGWYLTHEIGYLSTSNNYTRNVTVLGANPLRSLMMPIMAAPGDTGDITAFTAGNDVLISGVDIFAPQDAVGSGNDFVNNVYTYDENIPLSQIEDVFNDWEDAIQIANSWLTNNQGGRQIKLWSTNELWTIDDAQFLDYPTKIRRVVKQLENTPTAITKNIFYQWLGYVDDGNNSLKPTQSHNGLSDTADRAEGLFHFIKNDAL